MNRKILALIIFLVAVVGVYGLFYVAVTTVLMPMDLNNFKSELNAMPQLPLNNDSTITQMENAAVVMESNPSLKYMSHDQRTEMANQMRNSNSPPPGFLNQNFTDYNNFNSISALAYEMILKGTISNEINNLSSTTDKMSILANETVTINQKMANDFENGNDKAYADDLRNMANNTKQYNSAMAELKTKLQNIVNQLGG